MSEQIHFLSFEEIYPKARKYFEEEQKKILSACPGVLVEHVGSSAIPNSITLGDLDIQIRVDKELFPITAKTLGTMYHINHPNLWTDEFALFHWKDNPNIQMSVVLTVIDSSYDDFFKSRDFLKSHPDVLEEYNTLKREYEGKSYKEYSSAKVAFWGPNGNNRLLKML